MTGAAASDSTVWRAADLFAHEFHWQAMAPWRHGVMSNQDTCFCPSSSSVEFGVKRSISPFLLVVQKQWVGSLNVCFVVFRDRQDGLTRRSCQPVHPGGLGSLRGGLPCGCLRYFHRIRTMGWRNLAWDDALMLLATIVCTAESVMGYLVVAYWQGLANNAMTDVKRAALDLDSREYIHRVNGSKLNVVRMLLYNTVL
ncbi:hypothetical protein QBC34DRAFT_171908 [Podospora aff. communis PSN243]|uniref:ABC transmembrane type-1 domain-containing protein n=1 Tax=Podospora aff. communis PSN243 TaxID=3040156 RepID=A0AAV9GZV1_9PEZI|nr:hypothetical protein QBC34DRAFT_171908 [Podospora aff. communis PSN243]